MKSENRLTLALVASAFLLAMVGCQQREGPAEHAGKEVDKAADQAGKSIEKAGQGIQDAAKGKK
jgi:predicted small secreted protein